ncbi:MAG TPA: phosphate ABC transporter permease PstA [Thermomicrobiales bacterium]
MSVAGREMNHAEGAPLAPSPGLVRRNVVGTILSVLFLLAIIVAVAALVTLLWTIVSRGWSWLSWGLIENPPSRRPERAGLNPALFGTIWIIGLTALVAFPVGVATAIYLEEYAGHSRLTRILQVNIANLAGVPSVVYGLLGLGVFVEFMNMGRVVLAGALTMALLSLPVIIIASQEAIRAVPSSLREAAYGLGATRWQVARHHVLPAALPGILTGTILSISRAAGETAPLLVVGAAGFLLKRPEGLFSSYTALPIQVYQWTSRPQAEFRELAAAAIIVLLVVLLVMNATAIIIRQRASRAQRW